MPTVKDRRGRPKRALSRAAYDAVLFDLDGVLTDTAAVHAAAWKTMFDEFLASSAGEDGQAQPPFDAECDYLTFVDGKPRYEGVASFLQSRGITLAHGTPEDAPERTTVCGLGNRKNLLFRQQLAQGGAPQIAPSVAFVQHLKALGFRVAVVSSSRNGVAILQAAGLDGLFDTIVTGVDAARLNLRGKPHPDTFLEAARRLGVDPRRAVVVEDAVAGVEAGHSGHFGCVIGLDRQDHASALSGKGADLVVSKLTDIAVQGDSASKALIDDLPSALERIEEIRRRGAKVGFAVFLDYDGTLTPIAERPELAVLSSEMRGTLRALAEHFTVAIISGRDLSDARKLVDLDGIFYAGSHGFRIKGPDAFHMESEHGTEYRPLLEQAERSLREALAAISGVIIEPKYLGIAVHYRLVSARDVQAVESVVDRVVAAHPGLRKSEGKKVFDLQPDIDWDKGKAVLWLLEALGLDGSRKVPIYIGDDLTDEDAFQALSETGIGIVVKGANRPTAARYALGDSKELRRFLEALINDADRTAAGPATRP